MKKMTFIYVFMVFLLSACGRPYNSSNRIGNKRGFDLIKITKLDLKSKSARSAKSRTTDGSYGKDDPVRVTIFIHGTKFTPAWFMHDFFYSIPGINHINNYNSKYRLYKIAKIISDSDPIDFDCAHFYNFGWSGKLSFKERFDAAARLWADLNELIAKYKREFGYVPKITIITHSHGGNVALNLVKFAPNLLSGVSGVSGVFGYRSDVLVDRLILLACPVQMETESFVSNGMFKKVYAFCSGVDTIQILDPQGIQVKDKKTPLLSDRFFKNSPNLIQAKVKINGRGLMHVEFLLENFLAKMPIFIDKLESDSKVGSRCIISYWDNQFFIK